MRPVSIFDPLDPSGRGVFLDRGREIDPSDVGERCQPRQDIGKLFFEIFPFGLRRVPVRAGVGVERGREFAHLLHQQHKCALDPAGLVGREVSVTNEFLEPSKGGWVVVDVHDGS